MRDILPDASIGISIPASEFLDRIAILATELGSLRPDKHYQVDSILRMDILNLYPVAGSKHEDLLGQLIYTPDYGERISVEVRAHRWIGDCHPTYEIYVEALKFVFSKLLTAYNKKHSSRCRLTIIPKNACEHTLSPKAQEAFDEFVSAANKSGLHPLDWKRFYRFSKICYALHTHTNEEDVFRLLVHAAFTDENARSIAAVFGHLRGFQRL